ncbi:MAG: magnesium transporter [Pseudomonas fluorescens]|nr:MAG: magnesium transporter [Pseudomonas fluorescens]
MVEHNHYDNAPHRGLTDDTYIEILVALDADNPQRKLKKLLIDLHPADIADLIERLPREHRAEVVQATPKEHVGDMLAELEDGVKEYILQTMDPEVLKEIISEMESDDAADMAQAVEDMAEEEGVEIDAEDLLADHQHKHLLDFEPDTAGGLMQLEVVTALPTETVTRMLKYLRETPDLPNNPGSIFVVNKQRKLLGTISLGRLIRMPLTATLEDVMRKEPLNVQPEASAEEVIKIFEKYDIHNLAVLNKRGQLLGRITIDDVLDTVMDEEAYRQSAAAGVDASEDLFAPALESTRYRMPWLIVNLGTAIAAASVIALFENSIAQLTTLAVLMPIITSMGGNATTQTQTVVIRGLALGQITSHNKWNLFRKEFMVGAYKGIFLSTIMALGAWLIFGNPMLALVIALATVANHLIAAFAGWATPIVLKKFKYDPAISSGVITTTFTDVGGFFVFLSLATLLLL